MFSKTFSKLNLDVSSHDFRHTRITELVSEGMPIIDVQSYVGHSEAKTTLSYVKKKKTADILQGMIQISL